MRPGREHRDIDLTVTVTGADGTTKTDQKFTQVHIGPGQPVLEVLGGGGLVATSDPNGDTAHGRTQKDLLGQVYLRSGGNLMIQLRNISDQAPTHTIDTPNLQPIVLNRVGQTTTYSANVSAADLTLAAGTNSYTINDGHVGINALPLIDPEPDAESALSGLGFSLFGRMIAGVDNTLFAVDIDFLANGNTTVAANNFAAAGFSRVTLDTKDLEQTLEARFRVENQTSIMVNCSHGKYDGSLEVATTISGLHGDTPILFPAAVGQSLRGQGYQNGLQCLTFLSCDVMRVHGYRGDYGGLPRRLQPAPGQPDPGSPGIAWRNAAGDGPGAQVTLLGYNHNSWLPFDEGRAAQGFLSQFSLGLPPSQLARTWVENSTEQNSDSACAIDASGTYWFVKHDLVLSDTQFGLGPSDLPVQIWQVRRAVYQVSEVDWRKPAPLPPPVWVEDLPFKRIFIPPAAP